MREGGGVRDVKGRWRRLGDIHVTSVTHTVKNLYQPTNHMHAELKDGRVPQGVTKRVGYWKAEEFQKFTYPVSEYVLGGLLPDSYYHAWIAIVRITELVYKTGRSGWTANDSELITKLIQRHNILTEESEGTKSCVVTLHNLLHLPEDITNFSSLDNYWCYSFERAVKKYVERSSNCKNLESTFANAECRREFLKFFDQSLSNSPGPVNVDLVRINR